ncbi:MAG: glycosyltransferase family 39 protein [Chloroflexota bacterium]|nr:glycosyltransferase family 39 protein [Chloroflexota bacterium]MDQ5865354.1 glycosyltransferase family 39 protein [Chloroflexota bacterium]
MATLTRESNIAVQEAATPATRAGTWRETWADVASVSLACLIFFFISVYQLDLPGLYNDEAFDVIPAMQVVLGHPVELQRGVGINVFGTMLPLMSSSDYQGITSTYLAIPFFVIGGVNVFSLRLMTITVGLVAIVLAYFLARAWFGRPVARLTVLMLGVSPSWIFWSRLGVYVVNEVVPITTGALLAFTHWVRNRPLGTRNAALYTGMFLMGLGLTTKLLFLWVIVAVTVVGAILFGRRVWEHKGAIFRNPARWLRIGAFSLAAFCLGALPFLLYNLMTRGTWLLIRGSLADLSTTSHGVDNTAYLRNLWSETDSLKVVLDGGYFWFQGLVASTYSNPFTPTVFALSALGLMALALRPWREAKSRISTIEQVSWLVCGLGLTAAFSLVLGVLPAGLTSLVIMLAIGLGVLGIVMVGVTAFRSGDTTRACWTLLATATLSGTAWWFGGSGRPEGTAPGGPLGLWPVDAVGVLFWASGLGLCVVLGSDRHAGRMTRVSLAAIALIGVIVAQSAVTISGLWATHLIVVLPLPYIVIAAFLVRSGGWLAERVVPVSPGFKKVARLLPAVMVVGAIMVADLIVDYSYHRDLALGGGRSTFSDAVYRLSSYLDGLEPDPKVVAMDWGFKRPVQLLTSERVNPVEAYGYSAEPTSEFYEGLRELLQDPNTIYLFHDPTETAYPRFEQFVREAEAAGKTVTLETTFSTRDGAIVHRLYTAK